MENLNNIQKNNLQNKEWRLSHFYKIRDKQTKLRTFKMNMAQSHFHKNKWSRNIILKSRQLGFTTLEVIDSFDDVLWNRNFNALFIAQDLDTAKDIFSDKIELAWKNYKLKNLYQADTNSARQIKLGFGDNTFSSITVDNSGRSGTFQRLHITEFALICKNFPDKAKEIIEGSIPAVPLEGRIDIESTAEESEGRFYDMFWGAWERGQPKHLVEFKAHFYNWQWDKEEMSLIKEPILDLPIEFREYQKINNLNDIEITYYYFKWLSLDKDWQILKKQYPTTPYEAFEGSGNKLFDLQKVSKLIQEDGNKEGDWIFYDKYELGHEYKAGADVAEGVGQDSSTCVIYDFTPIKPRIVAVYRNNKIAPDLFAFEIKNGCQRYGNALIAVERNNHGHTTISKLKEIYLENCIYKDPKNKFGWETNLISKPKMIFDFSTAINQELIDIPDRIIISELRRYDKEELSSAKFDSEKTQHYDLLIASAIGFQMKNEKVKNQIAFQYKPIWK